MEIEFQIRTAILSPHSGTDPAIPNVFAVFIIIFLSCLLRDNIFYLLRKPPAMRCKAKFS